MQRYASIDFLRGLAIFLMLFLHMVGNLLFVDTILADAANVPLINIVILIIFSFTGGLAGLFLMISSIGNMISMNKHLKRGKSVRDLVIKQVIGGILLLIFAMLVEGIIGAYGGLGSFFRTMNNPGNTPFIRILYRWNWFETIHTIAWCVIINGIVQGILSRNGGWQNTRKLVICYAILTVVVLCATQIVWNSVAYLVPGYPFAIDPGTGIPIYMPVLGQSAPLYILASPFLAALAAPMEPLFPYLAVSFIGSIIGIVISQARDKIPRNFPKRMIKVGFVMFIVGLIGIIFVLFNVFTTQGFAKAAYLFENISRHRHWAPDNPRAIIPPFAWVWQFLCLIGFTIMAIMIIIRLVEFRGKGKEFAEKTTFIRRFGFVAFTNYTIQWIYYIMFFMMSLLFLGVPYERMNWGLTLLTTTVSLLIYYLIMWAWEKKRYIGSIEWCIGTIAFNLIPIKRESLEPKKKWWEKGALNVEGAFYNVEWLNIVEKEEIKHDKLEESKLAYKLSLVALFTIIFMPASFITYFLAKKAQKTEKINKYNKIAVIASITGMVLVVIFFVICSILTLNMLGISL